METRHRSITQPQHDLRRVEAEIIINSFRPIIKIAGSGRRRMMRIDDRRKNRQRSPARNFRDRKIVGGANQLPRHIGPRTRTTVRHPRRHARPNQVQLTCPVEFGQQHKCVATAPEDSIGLLPLHPLPGQIRMMQGFHVRKTDFSKGRLELDLPSTPIAG